MNSHTTSQVHMHKHLCWIGRGTHIRGTQHDNKLQHGHTQQDINGTVITCVHTCHLWDSHVFTLFVCGMQRIHKQKKVGCALTESLALTCQRIVADRGLSTGRLCHILTVPYQDTVSRGPGKLRASAHSAIPAGLEEGRGIRGRGAAWAAWGSKHVTVTSQTTAAGVMWQMHCMP